MFNMVHIFQNPPPLTLEEKWSFDDSGGFILHCVTVIYFLQIQQKILKKKSAA